MPKTVRCVRCKRRMRNPSGWNEQYMNGRVVANLCPDCQTPEENAEAEQNWAEGITQTNQTATALRTASAEAFSDWAQAAEITDRVGPTADLLDALDYAADVRGTMLGSMGDHVVVGWVVRRADDGPDDPMLPVFLEVPITEWLGLPESYQPDGGELFRRLRSGLMEHFRASGIDVAAWEIGRAAKDADEDGA